MANSQPAGTDDAPLKWVIISAAIYLTAHLIAPALPGRFWGVDGLVYGPVWFGLPLAFAFLITFVSSVRKPFSQSLIRSTQWLFGEDRAQVVLRLAILCGLFAVISFLWTSAIPLLGDGQLHARELSRGLWDSHPRTDRAPLTFWIMHRVYAWGGGFGSATDVYAWVSQVSGLGFLVLSALGSRDFSDEKGGRSCVFLILISQGYMMLFFGYVENYALLFPMLLAFLLLCQKSLSGQVPVWVPAVVLGITVAMHFVALAVAPALLWVALKRPEKNASARVVSLASTGVSLIVIALGLESIGLPFDTFLHSEPGSHILPVFGAVLYHQPHRLVSWDHFVEVLNQYALVAPAVLVCFGLFRKRVFCNATDSLLLLAAVPLFCFTIFFNPEIGAFRDWDAFALPALPMTLLVGRWIARSYQDSAMRSEVVSVVVVVSLVHTAMWLGLNADTQAAESRFTVLLRQAGNSQHARAYGASSLAGYYRDGGKFEESLQAFEEASRYDPENGRYHVGRAYVLSIQGNLEAAESALKQALELTPDRLEALINLGKLYLEAGRKAEAQSVFVRAVNRNGESEQALHGLATAHYRLGDYAAADALYRGAIRLVPNNAAYHIDLGNTLLQREKYDGAEASLRTALGIDSGSTRARMVLGAVHFGRGEYDLASRVFSKVTSVHPDRADAHLNLGLSLKAAGHLGRARVHLEQMLKLSPNDPESDEIRGMLEDLSGGDLNQ